MEMMVTTSVLSWSLRLNFARVHRMVINNEELIKVIMKQLGLDMHWRTNET